MGPYWGTELRCLRGTLICQRGLYASYRKSPIVAACQVTVAQDVDSATTLIDNLVAEEGPHEIPTRLSEFHRQMYTLAENFCQHTVTKRGKKGGPSQDIVVYGKAALAEKWLAFDKTQPGVEKEKATCQLKAFRWMLKDEHRNSLNKFMRSAVINARSRVLDKAMIKDRPALLGQKDTSAVARGSGTNTEAACSSSPSPASKPLGKVIVPAIKTLGKVQAGPKGANDDEVETPAKKVKTDKQLQTDALLRCFSKIAAP